MMAMRTEGSRVARGAVLEGSDDFHPHSLIACPRIPAIDTGFLDFYRNGLTRAAKIEEGLSDAEKIDVLSILVSCLAHLAAKDTSIAFVVRRHLQNFMSRLANLKINSGVCQMALVFTYSSPCS
jgi:alanine racemase